MKYSVEQVVFDMLEDVCFGIIVVKGLKNFESSTDDVENLRSAVEFVQSQMTVKEVKTHPRVNVYREALRTVGINPNKFSNSVEAMCKRVTKYGSVPNINAIVDLTNIIALIEMVTLGAHDLDDIKYDLAVRYSTTDDKFLPIGKEEFLQMPEGELVFTSGNEVQTRQWLWRQSDMGKITLDSSNIIFQLVGFKNEYYPSFKKAMRIIEENINNRFGGEVKVFEVNKDNRMIEF